MSMIRDSTAVLAVSSNTCMRIFRGSNCDCLVSVMVQSIVTLYRVPTMGVMPMTPGVAMPAGSVGKLSVGTGSSGA